jgi:hypothetical protein
MSEREDQPTSETSSEREQSGANPFAERDETGEQPQNTFSKKRAAAMGTAFGLGMTLLALICIAISFALSTCTA